jgi:hopanoid biosynthesis associated protein HpnK
MESGYLVFAADDLGRTESVNSAVMDAFDHGILTSASLMAGGEAFHEAVKALRQRQGLSVGLHITLCDGMSVLSNADMPDLTCPRGNFSGSAAATWIKLYRKRVLDQAEKEIEAQFDRLEGAGIKPDYVDGHHHIHMHPGLFRAVCRIASRRGVSWIRITSEPLRAVYSLGSKSRGIMPYIEWAVFRLLKRRNIKDAGMNGLRYARHVFGLSRTGELDEKYILQLLDLPELSDPFQVAEIFGHPDMSSDRGVRELDAFKSKKIASRLDSLSIKRIGYTGCMKDK